MKTEFCNAVNDAIYTAKIEDPGFLFNDIDHSIKGTDKQAENGIETAALV